MMRNGCIPAGRIMSNAGAAQLKPGTSLINCTVSQKIDDSIDGIMDSLSKSAKTLKAGCGIGYDFSTLRPKGSYVNGVGASTSGPLSFMDVFDSMCKTISSAGGRRGAQMGVMRIDHPDIEEFIKAKREAGRLRHFNLSIAVTDEFMIALKKDKEFRLSFNGKIYKTVKASYLWDLIMRSTYEYAEPGVLFVDRINQLNPIGFAEEITTTNPCGEQPLPPNGACLLGSVDVSRYVKNPFQENAEFDRLKFADDVYDFTELLDNVVQVSNLPLNEQQDELYYKRRHGMGITGLGTALTMLCIKYGSKESEEFTKYVLMQINAYGLAKNVDMAKRLGPCEFYRTKENRNKFIESGFFKNIEESFLAEWALCKSTHEESPLKDWRFMKECILEHGLRFTHHTSIAPTGTISLAFGNNCSNGIEPSYSHKYTRNIIVPGKATKEDVAVYSAEYLKYIELFGEVQDEDLPNYFVTADKVDPVEHLSIQGVAQKYVDSSISKTINVPSDYPFEKFKEIYQKAYNQGCKGCTTFRFNPSAFQGVLVKGDDLDKTNYEFILEDGSSVVCKGSDRVMYNNEEVTAANLFDALKEGYYGKL